jgi:hypothetical protein
VNPFPRQVASFVRQYSPTPTQCDVTTLVHHGVASPFSRAWDLLYCILGPGLTEDAVLVTPNLDWSKESTIERRWGVCLLFVMKYSTFCAPDKIELISTLWSCIAPTASLLVFDGALRLDFIPMSLSLSSKKGLQFVAPIPARRTSISARLS